MIANPGRRNPYRARDVPRFTRAARTPRQRRQWLHVYESARRRGYSEGRAIAQASGAVAKGLNPFARSRRVKLSRHPKGFRYSSRWQKLPRKVSARRNQNVLTDTFASQIAKEVASKVGRYFSSRKRSKVRKRKRRNVEMGFYDETGFHPIRASSDYESARAGEGRGYAASLARRKRAGRKARASSKKKRRNPHLAILGTNPRRRKRRRLFRRNAAGQFVKAAPARKKKYNPSRRRRRTRATPRRKSMNRARVITKIKYKTRYTKMANTRRRRKSTTRRRRRRTYNRAAAPRRRNRKHYNRRRGRLQRRRTYRRRRNPGGLGGLVGRVNFVQVAEVAGGVFLGDKLTTYLGNTVSGWLGVIDPTTNGLIKAGLGVVGAGLAWRFRPALALGIAVGAVNGLLNQYVFGPLWGYATPYLPAGMAGLNDYVTRDWRVDNWLAAAGTGTTGTVAGLGNSLNRSSL